MLTPLQFGVPGAAELLILLLILFLVFGLVGRWIYRDAKRRGSEWAWQWGVGIALLFLAGLVPGLLGVVIYLLVRPEEPVEPEPSTAS
jgi:4-amino-4-deoxy-L-arabinose transferase-like glycosyltransferase